jgi:hypothetical protein
LVASVRMMCKSVQAATNTNRCFSVWCIAVCRCPAVPCCPWSAHDTIRKACLRTLRAPLEPSEASPRAWRWSSVYPALQAQQARTQYRYSPCCC